MSDEIKVYSQREIDDARREGEKRLDGLTSEQILLLRKKAKHDLFFLAYGVLGYDKLSSTLHKEVCRWVEGTRNDNFRMLLLPRSHFKSTIFTISDTVQLILPDDSGTLKHPYNLGMNVRALIAHETDTSAQAFLASIRDHVLREPVLISRFPEITPERGRTDNKTGLELNGNKL